MHKKHLYRRFLVFVFGLMTVPAEPIISSLANRGIMLKHGDYFLIQTADSPLKAVSLQVNNDFCFKAVPNSQGLYILYYGSKGSGSRRLVLQDVATDKPKVNILEKTTGRDIDSFRIYSPAGKDIYVIQRGEFFVGVNADFSLKVGKFADFQADPEAFYFTVVLADEILAAMGIQIQNELEDLQNSFNDQVEAARTAARIAFEAQIRTAVENATDQEIVAMQKKVEQFNAMEEALKASTEKAQAEAAELTKRVYELEAAKQAEAAKTNGAIADFERSMAGMNPEQLAIAKEQLAAMKSSKEEMVKRLDEDAKIIAANKKRNIDLEIQVAALIEKKAKAEIDAAKAMSEAVAVAMTAQNDRVDALKEEFKKRQTEILKQTELLQKQLDEVYAENAAARETLKKLAEDQAKTQEEKNARINALQGILYAKDLITTSDVKGELKKLLPDQATAIDQMNAADLAKLAYNESKRVLADKQKLMGELDKQMQKLADQAKQMQANAQKIVILGKVSTNLEQAKVAAQTQAAAAVTDLTAQIQGLEKQAADFEARMLKEIADNNAKINAESSETQIQNIMAQERQFRQSIAQKKDEVLAGIQNLVNKTNASFDNLSALIEKDIANIRAEEESLTEETEKLIDDLASKGSADSDIQAVQDQFKVKVAELDARFDKATAQNSKLLDDKKAFNKVHLDRVKKWQEAARKLVDEQVNSLREQMANQSELLRADTEKTIELIKKQSKQELEKVENAQKESIRQMNAEFEANKKMQEAQMLTIQLNIENIVKEGQSKVANLEKQLLAAQDDKRLAIQAEIDKAKNASIALVTQLQNENKKTLDSMQAKLDERKQMQEDYIKELQSRKAWSEQALNVEIQLLKKLAAGERADTQEKYSNLIKSLSDSGAELAKKIQAETAVAVADLQKQIADQEKRAADEQALLQKQLAENEADYAKDIENERNRIEKLIGQEREDAQKQFDALKADKEILLENLKKNLDDQVKKAEQAKADAAAANELKVSMLEQQFADIEQLKLAVKVEDGEEILIQLPGDNKFLTATEAGQVVLQEGVRFDLKFRFKVAKEDRSKISIRTLDGEKALTISDKGLTLQPVVADAAGAKKANQQTQAFFLEGDDGKAVLRISDEANKKVGLIALDGKANAVVIKQEGQDFVWLKKMTSGSGTLESLLASLYADVSIESTERAIAMADVYFISNRVFNQPEKMQDFSMALSEFIDAKDDAKLLNESAAQKLGVLMDKMDRFVMKAGDTSDSRGKTEIDNEVLESLRKAKNFLDPISFKANSMICIRKDEFSLSSQAVRNSAGKTVLKFVNSQLFNPNLFLRVIPDAAPNTYAFETEDGASRMTYNEGNIVFSPKQETSKNQLFVVKGTRAATTFETAAGFVTVFRRAGISEASFIHMTQAEIEASKSGAQPLVPGAFQIDIFSPETIEYDFITKGLPEYNDDSTSKAAIGDITQSVRSRLFNQSLSNADKLDAMKKFEQYLNLYVNSASLLDWARAGQSLVDAAKQQMPTVDVKIFDPILKSVQAFTVKDGEYLLLQNIYNSAADRQGVNSYLVADETNKAVVSQAVEKFGPSALFKAIVRDNSVALVTAAGNYLEATDSGLVISQTKAVDIDQRPVQPTPQQLFKFVGSGTTVTIRVNQNVGGEDLGYMVVDAANKFNFKNSEDSDNPYYKLSNVKARFKVEVLSIDSLRYRLMAGDFDKIPGIFFEQMFKISESNLEEKVKTQQAKDILDTFTKMATEQITGDATVKNGFKLKVRDNMINLQQIPDKEDENIYPMGKALDFIKRYALYDKSFRKTGIKFDQADIDKFEMLEQLFPAPDDSSKVAPARKLSAVNIKAVTDPSGKGTPEDEFLSSLWKNPSDKMEGARILHAYLTKVANMIFADSFDDNSDLFGLDANGQIKDGEKIFMLKATEAPMLDVDNKPVNDNKNKPLLKSDFLDAENKPITKTIAMTIPATLDDEGNEVTPAETLEDALTLGIVIGMDEKKDPYLMLRKGQGLTLNPELDDSYIKEIKKDLTALVDSRKPIIAEFFSAQDLIKTMIASLSGMKKAALARVSITQKSSDLLTEAMKMLLKEEYLEADKILNMFKNFKGKLTSKERKALPVTIWTEGTPLYRQYLTPDQMRTWAMIKKENTKKMRMRKRADSKSKAPAAKKTTAVKPARA